MADKRITQITTEYDRDDYARATDYLLGDRGSGSSFKMLIEEAVLGALGSVTSNVGIGTTDPDTILHIEDHASAPEIRLESGSSSQNATLGATNTGTTGADFYIKVKADGAATSERLRITNNGTIRPGADNAQDLGAASYRFDDIYATNGTVQTSDRRLKSAIADSDLGLEFIETLRPVSFRRNGGARRHYGLIAQEVEAALAGRDFAGLIRDKTSGRYGLRYDELIGPLIKAVQELSQQVITLTQRIAELEQGAE